METGDLIFCIGKGGPGFLIQFGTRARWTHIFMVVRLNLIPTSIQDTGSVCSQKDQDKYTEFRTRIHSRHKVHPIVCDRDCLNNLGIFESTNHMDSVDILLNKATIGSHLVILFDKLRLEHYKYFGIRSFHSVVFSGSSGQHGKRRARFQTKGMYGVQLRRLWEFIFLVYSLPYDSRINSIFTSVHKSFVKPSYVMQTKSRVETLDFISAFKIYIDNMLCCITCAHNEDDSNDEESDNEGEEVEESVKNNGVGSAEKVSPGRYYCKTVSKLNQHYRRHDGFFCSSAIAAALRYCKILTQDISGGFEKCNDSEFSPDDFSEDITLLLREGNRYSRMKYFLGHDIHTIRVNKPKTRMTGSKLPKIFEPYTLLKDSCPAVHAEDLLD
jgi:hypothetical protein